MDKISIAMEGAIKKLDAPTLSAMEARSNLETDVYDLLRQAFHPRDCTVAQCYICLKRKLDEQNKAVVGMMMTGGSVGAHRRT